MVEVANTLYRLHGSIENGQTDTQESLVIWHVWLCKEEKMTCHSLQFIPITTVRNKFLLFLNNIQFVDYHISYTQLLEKIKIDCYLCKAENFKSLYKLDLIIPGENEIMAMSIFNGFLKLQSFLHQLHHYHFYLWHLEYLVHSKYSIVIC